MTYQDFDVITDHYSIIMQAFSELLLLCMAYQLVYILCSDGCQYYDQFCTRVVTALLNKECKFEHKSYCYYTIMMVGSRYHHHDYED